VARVSARFSKSMARRRLRPNQEKVRSTTQRRGRTTKPVTSSLRLTISRRSRGHLCHRRINLPGLKPPSARSVQATGSAGGSCRGRDRRHHGPGSPPNERPGAHRQPLAVDQGMDLAALHLLAGVVTHFVVFTARFSADLTDWLSSTAADRLASRPIRSRNAMCNSAQIASQTPSC
jgi:hypothetical protein